MALPLSQEVRDYGALCNPLALEIKASHGLGDPNWKPGAMSPCIMAVVAISIDVPCVRRLLTYSPCRSEKVQIVHQANLNKVSIGNRDITP